MTILPNQKLLYARRSHMYHPPRRQRLHHIREIQRTQDEPLRQLNVAAKRHCPSRHQNAERPLHADIARILALLPTDGIRCRSPQRENGQEHARSYIGAEALSHYHFVACKEVVAVKYGMEGVHHGKKAVEEIIRNRSVNLLFLGSQAWSRHKVQRRGPTPIVLYPKKEVFRIVANQRAHLWQPQQTASTRLMAQRYRDWRHVIGIHALS